MKKNVLIVALASLLGSLLGSPLAWADHPRLDEATRLIGEASFEDALEALEDVAESEHLTRLEVIRLLVLRSLVFHALGDERDLDANLTALASLEPNHSFTANVPPTMQSRFEELREQLEAPLDLEVIARQIRGGFQIDAQVQGDEGGLVEEIVIQARRPGGEWVQTIGRSASIPVRGEGAVEFYAVALGPGGSVLLEEGSELEPRIIGTPESDDPSDGDIGSDTTGGTTTDPGDGDEIRERRVWPWAFMGTGIAAIITGAVVAGVLVSRQNQGTQFDAPVVDWP